VFFQKLKKRLVSPVENRDKKAGFAGFARFSQGQAGIKSEMP